MKAETRELLWRAALRLPDQFESPDYYGRLEELRKAGDLLRAGTRTVVALSVGHGETPWLTPMQRLAWQRWFAARAVIRKMIPEDQLSNHRTVVKAVLSVLENV